MFQIFCLLFYRTIYIDALTVTGDVEEGLPSWQLPWKFNLDTTNSTLGPIEMAEEFGIGLLMLPLVSMLQHLAIAKFYTRKLFSYYILKINAKIPTRKGKNPKCHNAQCS